MLQILIFVGLFVSQAATAESWLEEEFLVHGCNYQTTTEAFKYTARDLPPGKTQKIPPVLVKNNTVVDQFLLLEGRVTRARAHSNKTAGPWTKGSNEQKAFRIVEGADQKTCSGLLKKSEIRLKDLSALPDPWPAYVRLSKML
jgi:hypothetical protein